MNTVPPRARGASRPRGRCPLLVAVPAAQSQSQSPPRPARTRQGAAGLCRPEQPAPFDRQVAGYENKIAELLARDLGWKLDYTWFPQRMGFVRNTLRARAADDSASSAT